MDDQAETAKKPLKLTGNRIREERLAQKLRENLRRRKVQSHDLVATSQAEAESESPDESVRLPKTPLES